VYTNAELEDLKARHAAGAPHTMAEHGRLLREYESVRTRNAALWALLKSVAVTIRDFEEGIDDATTRSA